MDKIAFVEKFKRRTRKFVLEILKLFKQIRPSQESLIIQKQLIRSAGSMASNYRAATRSRSRAEFYSKLCIVVEEADESLFWIELLEESKIVPLELIEPIKQEAVEILSVTAKARKTAQSNRCNKSP
ncbi:MAG: four helix bundle protein [Cyclobacteriaceae bacterium]|nr:MAG: four helix bundle protein [Cyclobacteriaceae bacterium]